MTLGGGTPITEGMSTRKVGLTAASSPHKHLFRRDHAQRNPVVASGHGADIDGPLFRPLKHNDTSAQEERRGMDPDAIGSRAPEIRRRYPWASTLLECRS
jgi:hypothetical protein